MPPAFQFLPSGISKLDTRLAKEVAPLPQRENKIESKVPDNFPDNFRKHRNPRPSRLQTQFQTNSVLRTKGIKSEADVVIIGAGWYFLMSATAIAAAGLKMTVYEANPLKVGKGQIGLTGKDDYFELGRYMEAQLMPDFTSEQLDRLPPVIKAIAELDIYKALTEKRKKIGAIVQNHSKPWKERLTEFASLDNKYKISKREVIEMKAAVIDVMKQHDVLKIVPEEADSDLVSSLLDKGIPVLMASGMQVNLRKMGLDHLQECPGFVKELLENDPATKKAYSILKDKQEEVAQSAEKTKTPIEKIPLDELPTVAIVGGGASARGAALEIFKHVDPQLLRIVSISPLPKARSSSSKYLDAARKPMEFRITRGYVTGLSRSPDGKTITGIEIANVEHENEKREYIPANLFVHTVDEILPITKKSKPFEDAMATVTQELQEKPARNGFPRNKLVVPVNNLTEITLRIKEPFKYSLREDEDLRDVISELVKKQKRGETPTIVVTGNNFMTRSLTLFAAELGYKGNFVQLTVPDFADDLVQHDQLEDEMKRLGRKWQDVTGHVISNGTAYEEGKFTLAVKDQNGKVKTVEKVDITINAAGKTASTPLVEGLKEKGYIGQHPSQIIAGTLGLHSKHPMLAGHHNFFEPGGNDTDDIFDLDSPTNTFHPEWGYKLAIDPPGWANSYEFARSVMEKNDEPMEPSDDEPSAA